MQNQNMSQILKIVGLVALAIVAIGAFLPASCDEECNFDESPFFSFDRFDEADNFGEGIAANFLGVNIFLFVVFGGIALTQFKGVLTVIIALTIYLLNILYAIVEGEGNDDLGWGWIFLLGGLILLMVAYGAYLAQLRNRPSYGYGYPPPGYSPYPPGGYPPYVQQPAAPTQSYTPPPPPTPPSQP